MGETLEDAAGADHLSHRTGDDRYGGPVIHWPRDSTASTRGWRWSSPAVVLVVRLASVVSAAAAGPGNLRPARGFTSSSDPAPVVDPGPGDLLDGAAATGSTFTGTAPGWFTDPFVRHEQRYWSGTAWTEHVMTAARRRSTRPRLRIPARRTSLTPSGRSLCSGEQE